jgi:outer membrane protein assembly factor BamB
MMKKVSLLSALIAGLCSTAPAISSAEDWPTFRGAHRTAVAPDTGLLQKWPASGPKLLWNQPGAGRGYASLAVAAGRIYTLGVAPSTAADKDEYLVAFDQKTGQQIWKTKTGEAWTSGKPNWHGSRSCPTVDADRVYCLTPQGVLVCCATADGKLLWQKNLPTDFEGKKDDKWGYSESVLVDGGLVVCTPGGPKATVLALDKLSGDVKWKVSRAGDIGAGHASIVPSDIGGVHVLVQVTGSGPIGIRAGDGKLLWSYPLEKTTAVIPTPIIRGDLVFFVAGYKRGGALLRQVPEGDGEVKVQEIYPLKPTLCNKHGGVVLVGDYLYGDSDDQGIPFCANLMTGEIVWKKRGSGSNSAAFAAADGHLYIRFASGQMVLAKADPKEYVETGSFKIPDSGEMPSWSHPVISDGKLYLRELDHILCFDLKPAN